MTVRELTLSQAAVSYGGTLLRPDCHFRQVSTDSRTLVSGDLFVALRGAHFDAHKFLPDVAPKAGGLVVQYPDTRLEVPQWVVPDTTLALGQLAALARAQFSGPLVAVTGSAGKTTVKEMVARILATAGPVLATQGNLNNHIGVPKTLLQLAADHRFAVIEMGASGPGEIDYLVHLAKPQVALVTNVLPAHIEGFGSLEGVARAKGEIYSGLRADGTAVLNQDEPWAAQWRAVLPCTRVLTCSVENQSADVFASDIELDIDGCAGFVLHLPEQRVPVRLQIPGRHNVFNAIAAAACAHAVGIEATAIAAGLETMQGVTGRMQVKAGAKGARIIDDTYNANPASMKAAIDVLAERDGRRVLVVGDMGELGVDAARMHREVGTYASDRGIDLLLATGELSAHVVAGFAGDACLLPDRQALAERLLAELSNDVTALVKGSRSAGMEEVVARVVATEEGAECFTG